MGTKYHPSFIRLPGGDGLSQKRVVKVVAPNVREGQRIDLLKALPARYLRTFINLKRFEGYPEQEKEKYKSKIAQLQKELAELAEEMAQEGIPLPKLPLK